MDHFLMTFFYPVTGESEDRAKTRERFNEMLKKYTEPEKKTKLTKLKTEPQETIVVGH